MIVVAHVKNMRSVTLLAEMTWSFAFKRCYLLCSLIDHDCLTYHNHCCHGVSIIVMFNFVVIMLNLIFCLLLMLLHKKMITCSVLRNDMVVHLQKMLFVLFVD